jgi:PAS domain S-box-containing protein
MGPPDGKADPADLGEDDFRELVENLDEGVGVVDPEERFVFVNPAGERIFGVAPGSLAGRSLVPFMDEDGMRFVRDQTSRRSRGERSSYVLGIVRPDGERRHLHVSAVPRFDGHGRFIGTFGTFRDITESVLLERELVRHRDRLEDLVAERTEELSRANDKLVREIQERKQAEEKVLQLQKLDAIGTLAGGIAHDFNNMMTNVLGQAELASRAIDEGDPLHERLVEIRESANHAVALTRQLLLFSRRQPIEPRPVDVERTLASMLRMLERVIGENISVRLAPQPGAWTVLADEGHLEQVIMNLALNARDAMPSGGTLDIETHNMTVGEDFARRIPDATPGRYVRITFRDTGTGMDRTVMRRIFEPFFTTKEAGVGTGLGLSVVYGIVRKHRGWIEVDSVPGRGTTFHVHLPRAVAGDGGSASQPPTPPSRGGGGERILLVEDNEGVCRFACAVLADAGYEVVVASGAAEALELFDDSVSLVFSDVVLPGMSGVDLAGELRARRPGLPVILTSGYTDERSQWPLIRERRTPFLQKPFGMDELLDAVERALRS